MAGQRVAAAGTLVLDTKGLAKLAVGDARTRGYLDSARKRGARVAVSAITLTEALRGGPRDPAVHRVLSRIIVISVTEGIARRVLGGAAWMYLHDSKGRMPDDSDFADVHGLDSQRFYNVLCMAHGSNPASFKGMVDKGYLPKDRAETCADEFKQVAYAVKKLIDPNVDVELAAKIKAAHKARWEGKKSAEPAVEAPK